MSASEDDPQYRLEIGGLVEKPFALSLADLRRMPSRTQITRHDCAEGWSCIGKWTGVPLGDLLRRAVLKPEARFIVFYCADTMDQGSSLEGSVDDDDADTAPAAEDSAAAVRFNESIDLVDAFHPQTILAYAMNGEALPIAHGAPLRLRLERQLGNKQAKYVMRIAVVESLAGIGWGKGGYWEDQGYAWYGSI